MTLKKKVKFLDYRPVVALALLANRDILCMCYVLEVPSQRIVLIRELIGFSYSCLASRILNRTFADTKLFCPVSVAR